MVSPVVGCVDAHGLAVIAEQAASTNADNASPQPLQSGVCS
jgi:hypothetical protein